LKEIVQSRIWVFAEERQGRLAEVGLELLGKALELAHPIGWKVALVLLGYQLSPLYEQLLSSGADEILVADHPLLMSYCNQSYARVLENSIRKYQPEILLFGATALGVDLGARLAARLRAGLAAHCIDLKLSSEGKLLALVPGWGGNVLATVYCPHTHPQMATVKPGVFEMLSERKSTGHIIPLEVNLDSEDITYMVLQIKKEEVHEDHLEKAEVVIAGGWGIGSKDDWHWVEQLASILNGIVGATRPPVDEGWVKESQMIGQSGRTIHPKLYIGIGISGQMHHMVGVKEAELMIAINQDPEAPIFELCDLGLVGDFKEIIPSLIKAIKNYGSSI
jgi:electron transfer flavoprotein alpha subunit